MDYSKFKKKGNVFVPGVLEDVLLKCEKEFGVVFPEDYKELLRFSDGCLLQDVTFMVFFSCGEGFHPKETLSFANSLNPNAGMFFIGRFAGDMFGYLKESNDRRIYSYFEESGEITLEAENLDALFARYLVPSP